MDCSPPGSSVHGIFQARILEWVASSMGSSRPRDWTHVSCVSFIGRHILYHCTPCSNGIIHYSIQSIPLASFSLTSNPGLPSLLSLCQPSEGEQIFLLASKCFPVCLFTKFRLIHQIIISCRKIHWDLTVYSQSLKFQTYIKCSEFSSKAMWHVL